MFNRYMMALARDSRGETQSDLAKSMGVWQGTVSKYESGIKEPPAEFVQDLADHLQYKPSFFHEVDRPHGMPPFHYRKRKKLGVKALNKIIAEINIRRLHVSKLMRAYEDIYSKEIPEIDRDEYVGKGHDHFSLDDVANHLRDIWLVSPGPIDNVVNLIESWGGIVIPCDFGTNLIDAMSQRIEGLPVLFFININSPADRIRMTLCHELGHMILHTTSLVDDEIMEKEADKFAGCFLLPTNEIRPQLRNKFNLRHLANLKMHWKVAMQAIAVRAEELDLITPYQYKMFFIEMGKLGYRKREPYEPPKEKPRLLRIMIKYHTDQLGYTKQDLSDLLQIYPEEIDSMYGEDKFEPTPTYKQLYLRVVK